MEKFIIHGQTQLSGELVVNGAKNHALKLIPACFLASGPTVVSHVPDVEDVARLMEIVREIGGSVKQRAPRTYEIQPPKKCPPQMPAALVSRLRASLVLIGPLLARYGRVELPHPGGCVIGKRPIDFFVDGFKALGAKVERKKGRKRDNYFFSAPKGLHGASICFPNISVTGTETLMMAATLAQGTTVLKNAASEPEIVALAKYLNSVGARIRGAGTNTITIVGGKILQGGKVRVMPDRVETGSFVVLAAATKSHLTITNCNPAHLDVPLAILRNIGVPMKVGADTIEVLPVKKLQRVSIVTHEYPGVPTDLQAPLTVLLTQASGESEVRETIYEGRMAYIDLLKRMGANIALQDAYRALVKGPTTLYGSTVESPDIRAGIAMVIAGLIAEGTTHIHNIYQIDRGYERIEERLQSIGAAIERVND